MPTYEYACRSCGEHLEVVQSFRDDALTTCPSCEGELRKVFSAAGIIFKGSGWHVKDYASKGASTSTTAGSGDGSSDSGGSDAGSSSSDASSSSSSSSSSSKDGSGSSSAESA
jgi:putative FmdB family regulatory protein